MKLSPAILLLIAFLGALGALVAVSLPEIQRYLKIRSM
jgi:hypothetical protein